MIFSPDGHCRAFDAKAQERLSAGVGIVVMKRLEDAIADADYISCGHQRLGPIMTVFKVGYSAPSVDGQAEVIAEALAIAEVEPETVTYIEAHGTGTLWEIPLRLLHLHRLLCQYPEAGFCYRFSEN